MSTNSERIALTLRLSNATYHAMHEQAERLQLSHNDLIERAVAFFLNFGCAQGKVNEKPVDIIITAPMHWR